jgi:hypothetical protein
LKLPRADAAVGKLASPRLKGAFGFEVEGDVINSYYLATKG